MPVADDFVKRLRIRCGNGLAIRILERGTSFRAGSFPETPLVLLVSGKGDSVNRYFRELLLSLNRTWKLIQVSEQKREAYRDALAQNIVKRLEKQRRPVGVWHGQASGQKELTVFRDIATIFVNRGSRPDLAKKAERDLVKILNRESELVMTKRTVTELEEQVRKQRTLITELRQKIDTVVCVPEPDVGRVAGEVMRRMEREMHLERLRRGL